MFETRPNLRLLALVPWLLLAAGACTGVVSMPSSQEVPSEAVGPDELGPPRTGQDPSLTPAGQKACATPPDTGLRRISPAVYRNTLRTVFGADTLEAVEPALRTYQPKVAGTFESELSAISAGEVASVFDVAVEVAFAATASADRLHSIAPCLAEQDALSPPNEAFVESCVRPWLDEGGARLWRRPLTEGDKRVILNVAFRQGQASLELGMRTIIAQLLTAPAFVYERLGDPHASGAPNDHFAIAAFLARTLWRGPPDDVLWAQAQAGFDAGDIEAQVERMWALPKTRETFGAFVMQWLNLANRPPPSAVLVGSVTRQAEGRDLLTGEVVDFARNMIFDRAASYEALLTDSSAWYNGQIFKTLYGHHWAAGAPLPAQQRAGLLTRAGWLLTEKLPRSNAGHLIKRGARLAEFLCEPIEAAMSAEIDNALEQVTVDKESSTLRERFAAVTAEQGCRECHELIDNLGAGFGRYGHSGQWIEGEGATPRDAAHGPPPDTHVSLALDTGHEEVNGPLEVSTAIGRSDFGARCLVRRYMQFISAEEWEEDACWVETIVSAFEDADHGLHEVPLAEIFKATVTTFAQQMLTPNDREEAP